VRVNTARRLAGCLLAEATPAQQPELQLDLAYAWNTAGIIALLDGEKDLTLDAFEQNIKYYIEVKTSFPEAWSPRREASLASAYYMLSLMKVPRPNRSRPGRPHQRH